MLSGMAKKGESLGDPDLSIIEKKLGSPLPEAYRDFLTKYNGGVPVESYIDFNGDKSKLPGDEIKRFYGYGGKPTTDFIHKMESIGNNLPEGVLPIANTHGGNFFLLSFRSDSYGEIFYKDHEIEDRSPFDPNKGVLPESIVKISSDFDEFISKLYEADE